MSVITNTSVISNFAAVKRLELLRLCFEKLYRSEQVFEEIQTGLLQGYTFYDNFDELVFPFSETGWLHLTTLNGMEELKWFGQLLLTLHSGEASCLSIAYHRHWAFLTDDKAARQASQARLVPVTGTLGVLLSLVKHQNLRWLSKVEASANWRARNSLRICCIRNVIVSNSGRVGIFKQLRSSSSKVLSCYLVPTRWRGNEIRFRRGEIKILRPTPHIQINESPVRQCFPATIFLILHAHVCP